MERVVQLQREKGTGKVARERERIEIAHNICDKLKTSLLLV